MQTQTNGDPTGTPAQATDDGTQTADSATQPSDTTPPSDPAQSTGTGCGGSATTASDPDAPQSSQLDHVQHKLAAIEARLSDGRVFAVLEAVRDQFGELREQNRRIRNTVMDLQKTVLTA